MGRSCTRPFYVVADPSPPLCPKPGATDRLFRQRLLSVDGGKQVARRVWQALAYSGPTFQLGPFCRVLPCSENFLHFFRSIFSL